MRLLGTGSSLPRHVRYNDDPVFAIQAPDGRNVFDGYEKRRVLGSRESIVEHMQVAAKAALDDTGQDAGHVAVLLGDASLGEFEIPNGLADVHRRLNLPPSCWLVPARAEFSFNTSLLVADALLRARPRRKGDVALIVCGCDWTRHVDYTTAQSAGAGDGAGAAVAGWSTDEAEFALVDAQSVVASAHYGSMYMAGHQVSPRLADFALHTAPYFQITADAMANLAPFSQNDIPEAATDLLKRHRVRLADVSLISHQASGPIMEWWRKGIGIPPGQHLDTLKEYGNIVCACVPVTLAQKLGAIRTPYLLLLEPGAEFSATVLLLRHRM